MALVPLAGACGASDGRAPYLMRGAACETLQSVQSAPQSADSDPLYANRFAPATNMSAQPKSMARDDPGRFCHSGHSDHRDRRSAMGGFAQAHSTPLSGSRTTATRRARSGEKSGPAAVSSVPRWCALLAKEQSSNRRILPYTMGVDSECADGHPMLQYDQAGGPIDRSAAPSGWRAATCGAVYGAWQRGRRRIGCASEYVSYPGLKETAEKLPRHHNM